MRFYGDLAYTGNGVLGIDANIGQDLLDLGGSKPYRPQLTSRLPGQIHILTDKTPKHFEHTLHDLVQVEHFRLNGSACGQRPAIGG